LAGVPNVLETIRFAPKDLGLGPEISDVALARVVTSMQGLKTTSERAARALSLFCEAARSSSGYLFLARDASLALAAVQNAPGAPATLVAFIERYWAQLLDDQDMCTALTSMTQVSMAAPMPFWTDPAGTEHHLLALIARGGARDQNVGLIVLIRGTEARTRRLPDAAHDLASALAQHFVAAGDVVVRSTGR